MSSRSQRLRDQFFPTQRDTVAKQLAAGLPLTPKFLVVAPGQPLSWQYHHRRSELWHVVAGPVGLVVSDTDELPTDVAVQQAGASITIAQGQRHRLVGLGSVGDRGGNLDAHGRQQPIK